MTASFAATYEATPTSVGVLRNQIAALARELGLPEEAIGDIRLAVSEAATNALVHGVRGGEGSIRVEAQMHDEELQIVISDDGVGMQPRPDSPGLGLGLPVIATVADRLEILDEEPGTRVEMIFRRPRPAGTAGR